MKCLELMVFATALAQEAYAKTGDPSAYAKSTIVATSAPRELGSLRQADGAEGFEVPRAVASKAA